MSARPVVPQDLIDPRIDVYAQRALYRMMTGPDPGAADDARQMLASVRSGLLGGIYISNQLVPAKRARAKGTWWWLVIPKGEDAALMPAPPEPPIIVFRDEVKSVSSRLDPALRRAYSAWRGGQPGCLAGSCPIPVGSAEPRCGIPPGATGPGPGGVMAEWELEVPASVPRPTLSFFQEVDPKEGLGLFKGQAARWARRIKAAQKLSTATCPSIIGPTPYTSGMDILRAIDAVFWCLNVASVEQVHIFGHSYPQGLIGSSGNFSGLYRTDPVLYEGTRPVNRSADGATVQDVQTLWFAEDAKVVLHGCNTAKGEENFARSLFERLASGLREPVVYGHPTSVCAGQDSNWREYSRRSPTGRIFLNSIPVYSGDGGMCGKLPSRQIR